MTQNASRPIALTIAGSDSSGGAGIQADLKTFFALRCYGASVLTALTAQNTVGVQGVFPVPPEFVRHQLDSVLDDLEVGAIKTGMLASAPIISAIAERCADIGPAGAPLIVDPVMVATSGDLLIEDSAVATMRDRLFPLAMVITPNLNEAAVLLGKPPAKTRDDMMSQARDLLSMGPKAVLLKGGHLVSAEEVPQACDVLATADGHQWFAADWVETPNTHGTGCTLAAAIAARTAHGDSLRDAVAAAKDYLTRALISGRAMKIGRGHGPVDHLVGQT